MPGTETGASQFTVGKIRRRYGNDSVKRSVFIGSRRTPGIWYWQKNRRRR